ncbi:hypothetical protein QBC33DRAFT_544406 [Phialemonium atrogriseum]|uniref:Uncharacterized protein n=1 Tax=Phialemonium atrogriseum TaxID=1093897 RepID=A0AAJ0FLV3_9PEZI|nr:uncharacterized protein QBC33DRAFT_544406 [Phialemonium atrogriseum]KAK1765480.1 hypothetical protein QBC33DRAFT_544406 [Phialemonium atrogriseum]
MPPPSRPPLLALPTRVRLLIYNYVEVLEAEGDIKGRCTGLLNTCRQIRQELHRRCLPEGLTRLPVLTITLETSYNPLYWLSFGFTWLTRSGKRKSTFSVASLDDPFVTLLLQQVKIVGDVYVWMEDPRERNNMDSFLLLFSKVQDAVSLLRRLNICCMNVYMQRWAERTGAPFWENILIFPDGYGDLKSSRHQGGRYYEYLSLPFAEIGDCETGDTAMRLRPFPDTDKYPCEFRATDSHGEGRFLGYEKLFDWIGHRMECHYCRRGKPRSWRCKRRWNQYEGITKGYAKLRKRSNNLAHEIYNLVMTCDGGTGTALDSLRHHSLLTRNSSELNFLSVNNRRHRVHSSVDLQVRDGNRGACEERTRIKRGLKRRRPFTWWTFPDF